MMPRSPAAFFFGPTREREGDTFATADDFCWLGSCAAEPYIFWAGVVLALAAIGSGLFLLQRAITKRGDP